MYPVEDESTMLPAVKDEKSWVLVSFYQSLIHPLAIVGLVFGIASICGYLFDIEPLYRPITDGPATNPLTAMCMIFIGLALRVPSYKKHNPLPRLFCLIVVGITTIRIFDYNFKSDISALITPFHDHVLLDLSVGKSNNIGINSAFMFLCIALSLSFSHFQKLATAQFLAFFTLAIPMVSITGYVYGLDQFYGQMSLLTASTGVALSIATLAMTANVGVVKAILSPYLGGRIARLQTICGYVIPSLLGFLLVKSLNSTEVDFFGLYVVTICWFIILMVSVSAIVQERIDIERREGERLLLLAAMCDNLTGLANRRKFVDFGQEAIVRAKRNKKQMWLLMLDIDYFKKINDTAGHDMGDKVLIEVSNTLKNSIRAVDLVSRMGGEEFSIILLDTDAHGAELVAEKIRVNIESMQVEGWTDVHGPVKVSIGCALNDGTFTLENSLKRADSALYQAKNRGRNQVSFYGVI